MALPRLVRLEPAPGVLTILAECPARHWRPRYDGSVSKSGDSALAGFAVWIGKNIEALIALLVALAIAVLAWFDVVTDPDQVNSATLLVLAVLAVAVLRDRSRSSGMEQEVSDRLAGMSAAVAQLTMRIERVKETEHIMAEVQHTLDRLSMVRVLRGAEVGQALAEARRDTDRWIFKGGTGTYIRAVTLPECVENARRERRPLRMRLEIIDPTNEELCDHYAKFRRSLSSQPDGTGEIWTLDRTRKEAFATILAASWYRQRSRLLDIEVGLSSVMTTSRWDISSSRVVVTQEDPRTPAMTTERGKYYYDSWSTELQISFEQAARVPLEQAKGVPLSDEPTVDEARRLFTNLNIQLPHAFTDRAVSDIIQKAVAPKNPFE
jgi:hypothetical protein